MYDCPINDKPFDVSSITRDVVNQIYLPVVDCYCQDDCPKTKFGEAPIPINTSLGRL